jgi:hypothetical protein
MPTWLEVNIAVSVPIYNSELTDIFTHCCQLTDICTHCCQLTDICTHYCQLTDICTHCCQLTDICTHCCQLTDICTHCCQLTDICTHCCQLTDICTHCCQLTDICTHCCQFTKESFMISNFPSSSFAFPFFCFLLVAQGCYNKAKGHIVTVPTDLATRNSIEACAFAFARVRRTKHGGYTVTNCEVPWQASLWFCLSFCKPQTWRCAQCSGLLASRPGRTSRGWLVNGRFGTIYQGTEFVWRQKVKE